MKLLIPIFLSFSFSQYYNLEITGTGQSHLVVILESINLEPGTEIGIFDQNAITNDGNCDTEYGELLVATGLWNGEQLNLSTIGSIDFCDVGGEQRAGYVEDNEIVIRVYNPNEFTEYTTSFLTFDGIEPSFNSGYWTTISEISIEDIYAQNSIENQNLVKDFNLNQIYPNPANPVINVDFDLSLNQKLNLTIFSITGELVQEIYYPTLNLGNNSIQINLDEYSSGIYFLQLNSSSNNSMQKFVVLK